MYCFFSVVDVGIIAYNYGGDVLEFIKKVWNIDEKRFLVIE
jgi:hypothetical protein